MKVTLKSITPNAEINIVEIARVSSSRKDKSEKPEGLINYLIKNKHWSPFEHSYMTIEIETSKAIGIQLLRHVSFRFQEFSQRYAIVEGIEPIEFRIQADSNRQSSTDIVGTIDLSAHEGEGWRWSIQGHEMKAKFGDFFTRVARNLQENRNLYKEGLGLGIARECMRMILPMATSTKIYMTGSIRSWIHMLEIRDDSHSQLEAQRIAKAIKDIFIKELPIISNALGYVSQEDKEKYTEQLIDKFVKDINDADIHVNNPITGERIEVKASKKE